MYTSNGKFENRAEHRTKCDYVTIFSDVLYALAEVLFQIETLSIIGNISLTKLFRDDA